MNFSPQRCYVPSKLLCAIPVKIEHFVLTAVKNMNIVFRRTDYFLLRFCPCVLLSKMQFRTEVERVLEYRMFHLTDCCWCDMFRYIYIWIYKLHLLLRGNL